MMVKPVVYDKQKIRQNLMQDGSQNTRKFWTKNRISILIPWMTPLVVSILVALYDVKLAFVSFVLLSVIAWVVVNLRSPFAKDSADSPKFKEGLEPPDGSVLSGREIRKVRYWMVFFLIISFLSLKSVEWLPVLFPMISFPLDPSLMIGVLAFFIFVFQCLSKTYLIVRDLPLNGFPFFRSNSRTRNNSDTKISVGVMDNSTNPLHPSNIGNPANPNYIFK